MKRGEASDNVQIRKRLADFSPGEPFEFGSLPFGSEMSQSADKPLFTTLRFIPSNGDPESGIRRIAAQACDTCRRKKKRCTHTPGALASPRPVTGNERTSPTSAPITDATVSLRTDRSDDAVRPFKRIRTSDERPTTSRSEPSHSRFIGDLNPDVELLSGSAPNGSFRNNVGVWHRDEVHSSRPADSGDMFTASSLLGVASHTCRKRLAPLIEELCLNVRPPLLHFQAMEKFYFASIDPILPAVDAAQYRDSPLGSPAKNLQDQIVCILASLNPLMAGNLMLSIDDGLLSPADFARKVIGAMRLAIELALVSDKTVIIRALIAMSLVTYGPETIDLTSQYFVRAVHLAYTIGIHLPQDEARDNRVAGLFCYIWSIDRLHAAIQGRPIFIHEIDMGKHPRDCMVSQSPGFQALIYIATLLDKTIELYRPGAVAREISDVDFPTFEEIATDCGALDLPSGALSTLELFYHAVGILSCRHRSGSSSQGHLARNTRQVSSAMQINSIMEENTLVDLVLLPFVPYAVSLALSAAYRDYKHCKAASHRSRARRRLVQSHRHLLSLGKMFWSAAFVSELATKILRDTESNAQPHEATQEVSESTGETRSGTTLELPSLNDTALGHEWNTTDLDFFLEGNLDPSMPWDIEGLLAFPSLDQLVP